MIKFRGIKKGGDLFKVFKRYYFFLKLNEVGGMRIQFLVVVKQTRMKTSIRYAKEKREKER